jgi:hypothetical protein
MFGLHDRIGRFRALLAALLHQDNQVCTQGQRGWKSKW